MKHQHVFLSVILPTYNRRHCISRMIDSILIQSFKDFELIIIDDGSTDGTKEMLEKKYDDKRIRIIYKENGGVSSARNLGISLACGKYITFVDSDDYLLDGFFRDIHNMAQKYQFESLVYGGYILKHHRKKEAPLFWFNREYGKDMVVLSDREEFIKNFYLLGGNSWTCAKVFKVSVIQKRQILFDSNITYGEDLLFNVYAYFASSKIITSPKKFYVCDQNSKSLSRGMLSSKEKVRNLLYIYKRLEKTGDFESFFAFNISQVLRNYFFTICFTMNNEEKRQIKTIYAQVPIDLRSGGLKELEFRIIKQDMVGKKILLCAVFGVYRLYANFSFLHPLTSPILRQIKQGLRHFKRIFCNQF